jgi:signal transduction histidine kinase
VLSRATVDRAARPTNYLAGLDYRYYEGGWEFLPDFGKLQPKKSGVAANFDLKVGPQNDNVGLEFTGFIKIPEDGVYTFHVNSDDGCRLFIGAAALDVRVVSGGPAPVAERTVPARVLASNSRPWVTFEGTVDSAGIWSSTGELWMRVGDDDIHVEVFDGTGEVSRIPQHGRVRVTGIYEVIPTEAGSRVPGRLLALNWHAIQPVELAGGSEKAAAGEATARLSVEAGGTGTNGWRLSTAAEVKALSPQLAEQRLPVSIRGVVTLAKRPFAVIQDSTKGVYVDLSNVQAGEPIRRGEICQVEGVTGAGLFAPIIIGQRVIRLGVGQLPMPVRATWAQLMNGGLDSEYVEIDGVVTEVQNRQLKLLTPGGKIAVELRDFRPEVLPGYADTLIRIRGCCRANFNMVTRQVETGSIVIDGALVEVLERAPRDLFAAPGRSIGELLFYDPEASPFRRLKISGQVLYSRAGECFLTDGTNGVHVTTREPTGFDVGELVDAVGFLSVGGHAIELTEAVIRRTGRAPLPPPLKLPSEELLQARHVGTLVQTEATLINHWREASEHVLELQSGFIAFRARVGSGGRPVTLPADGSRLEVTGVYAPQGMEVGDGTVKGFELLLASVGGVRVLTTPPWWTLKRVLILAGVLAAILGAVLIWNKELQWKVEERGRQLETEIGSRQRAELQRAAEAERTRIARDLHDDLGTGLTEVSLLASAGLGPYHDEEKIRDRFHNIAEKARGLVTGLDVIVWAIDPKRNLLQSFADYAGRYARELFAPSTIDCRLRIRMESGTVTLSEAARHSLFLAVKEALNNVIRHSAATEVELQILQTGDRLHIVIADNGSGFDPNALPGGNGLTNFQERLQAMRGECQVESLPGKGTTVRFTVPVPCDVG